MMWVGLIWLLSAAVILELMHRAPTIDEAPGPLGLDLLAARGPRAAPERQGA